MKTIKIVIIIFIFNILNSNISAQVSGFLGKKNVISGSLFMKSSFVMPNKNAQKGYFSFNDHYSLEFERVISRKHSIKIHITTFDTKFNLVNNEDFNDQYLHDFSTKAFGFDYVWYKQSSIAPLGAYLSAGFDVFFCDVSIDTAIVNQGTYFYEYALLGAQRVTTPTLSVMHAGANIKTGVKQIFFNCISFDLNFQIGAILTKSDIGDPVNNYNINDENVIKERVGTRLWGHYLWGVNCSVGFVF